MHLPKLHDRVRLTQCVPTLWLRHGETGVVVSVWLSPTSAYEVEFRLPDSGETVRALLSPEQVEVFQPSGHDPEDGANHE